MQPWKIYKITNKVSGKNYIGITSKPIEKRFKEHVELAISEARRHRNGTLYALHAALIKHGVINFEIESLESDLTLDAARLKETAYIRKFNSYGGGRHRPDYPRGYNETIGGEIPNSSELEYASGLTYLPIQQENTQSVQSLIQKKSNNQNHPETDDSLHWIIILFALTLLFVFLSI